MTYTITYENKRSKLFKIDGPNPPPYFAKGCKEAGRELSHLDLKDEDVSYNIELVDQHLIRGFIHANRVLSKLGQKPPRKSIDSVTQST